jgi:4-oxalomesaconate tautomerase
MCSPASFETAYVQRVSPTDPIVETWPSATLYAWVPKISLVAAPADGGTICTRTFIPIRVHDSIGVLGAVSVATALLLDGAAGADLAVIKPGQTRFGIEHPTGQLEVETEVDQASQPPQVVRSGVVRTARKLFDGTVFPRRSW